MDPTDHTIIDSPPTCGESGGCGPNSNNFIDFKLIPILVPCGSSSCYLYQGAFYCCTSSPF